MRILITLLSLMLLSCAEAGSDDDFAGTLEERLNKSFRDVEVTDVGEAPVEGMREVELNGRDRVYVTEDGSFMFSGDLFEITADGATSVGEQRFAEKRRAGLAELDREQMISFTADEQQAELFVFTDVSCGYCRKLHQQMEAINDKGITVHYLAFPRGGMGAGAAGMMEQVWCADDRQRALTEAKLQGQLSESVESCDNPVAEQYEIGIEFGVRGTPAIFTTEGEQLGGYVPPAQLARALGLEAPASD